MAGTRFIPALTALLFGAACATGPVVTSRPASTAPSSAAQPSIVTLASPSPLIEVKMMVKAGSIADPEGKEGLAALVAGAILQGGFGDPGNPVTKEELAEITQAWGQGALPSVLTSSQTTTFNFTIPRDVLPDYLARVMDPMLNRPLFSESEIDRLKNEAATQINAARFVDLESLGLAVIDQYILAGTRFEHQPFGTELSVPGITRDDVVRFHRDFYRAGNIILGISSEDPAVVEPIARVVRRINSDVTTPIPSIDAGRVVEIRGREAVIIEEPNAPAASLHLGFPLPINRTSPDFWPLYVANVWLGTHRDSFGRLYQAIREERGYNYGNYSYIEHLVGRPRFLFPPFNTPRDTQHFSIWIRPVAHEFAYPLLKAATWELDRLVREGLTDEQVIAAKNKARVLYVNLAETLDRLLAAKIDDAFYGMTPGYLEGYLERIDAVTADQVREAVRKALQTTNIRYLVVTDSAHAPGLAQQIRENQPSWGKELADYQIDRVTLPDGRIVWQVSEDRLETIRLDAVWANYPLDIRRVEIIPVAAVFREGRLFGPAK
ncbi:MAG TPA: pitrilysin family protein [Thermoanaerobaculia bacterium]|nr:pitrilysin family protein [Thermoanaerobaculia bacterium]